MARINGPVHGRGNIQADVSALKKELEPCIKGVTTKKREAASHLLLFMISDELRNFKPYAVPVRVIKCKSITDAMLREFKEELRKVMKECGMTTVGMYKVDFFKSQKELHFPAICLLHVLNCVVFTSGMFFLESTPHWKFHLAITKDLEAPHSFAIFSDFLQGGH